MTDSTRWKIAQALRKACREEFGTDWCNDVALRFADAAIKEFLMLTDTELRSHRNAFDTHGWPG